MVKILVFTNDSTPEIVFLTDKNNIGFVLNPDSGVADGFYDCEIPDKVLIDFIQEKEEKK